METVTSSISVYFEGGQPAYMALVEDGPTDSFGVVGRFTHVLCTEGVESIPMPSGDMPIADFFVALDSLVNRVKQEPPR